MIFGSAIVFARQFCHPKVYTCSMEPLCGEDFIRAPPKEWLRGSDGVYFPGMSRILTDFLYGSCISCGSTKMAQRIFFEPLKLKYGVDYAGDLVNFKNLPARETLMRCCDECAIMEILKYFAAYLCEDGEKGDHHHTLILFTKPHDTPQLGDLMIAFDNWSNVPAVTVWFDLRNIAATEDADLYAFEVDVIKYEHL